jgi:hypothetical protein
MTLSQNRYKSALKYSDSTQVQTASPLQRTTDLRPQELQTDAYQSSAERLQSEDRRDTEGEGLASSSTHKNEALDDSIEIGSQKQHFMCFTEQ